MRNIVISKLNVITGFKVNKNFQTNTEEVAHLEGKTTIPPNPDLMNVTITRAVELFPAIIHLKKIPHTGDTESLDRCG